VFLNAGTLKNRTFILLNGISPTDAITFQIRF